MEDWDDEMDSLVGHGDESNFSSTPEPRSGSAASNALSTEEVRVSSKLKSYIAEFQKINGSLEQAFIAYGFTPLLHNYSL
jgi:hypothetical protein